MADRSNKRAIEESGPENDPGVSQNIRWSLVPSVVDGAKVVSPEEVEMYGNSLPGQPGIAAAVETPSSLIGSIRAARRQRKNRSSAPDA